MRARRRRHRHRRRQRRARDGPLVPRPCGVRVGCRGCSRRGAGRASRVERAGCGRSRGGGLATRPLHPGGAEPLAATGPRRCARQPVHRAGTRHRPRRGDPIHRLRGHLGRRARGRPADVGLAARRRRSALRSGGGDRRPGCRRRSAPRRQPHDLAVPTRRGAACAHRRPRAGHPGQCRRPGHRRFRQRDAGRGLAGAPGGGPAQPGQHRRLHGRGPQTARVGRRSVPGQR